MFLTEKMYILLSTLSTVVFKAPRHGWRGIVRPFSPPEETENVVLSVEYLPGGLPLF